MYGPNITQTFFSGLNHNHRVIAHKLLSVYISVTYIVPLAYHAMWFVC